MSVNDVQTRVAIMAATEQNHTHLSVLLGEAGLKVVMHDVAGVDFIRHLENIPVDVLLVDLTDDTESEVDIIDTLLEYETVPVFFNDSSKAGGETNAMWAKKLARKLEEMAKDFENSDGEELAVTQNSEQFLPVELNNEIEVEKNYRQEVDISLQLNKSQDTISEEIASLQEHDATVTMAVRDKTSPAQMPDGAAVNVWVLGASLGGPQAVRQFLMAIREDLPVAFILAQHIGENHITLLGEQLDRISNFKVFPAYNGHMVRHHEVILVPAGKNIHITGDGYISLSDQKANAIYSPCINDVMQAVATRYGNMAGTIIFSGMGDDGAIGCRSIAENGGIVWAQDVESCVISSMPDQARMTNNVTFSANPGRLADELYKYYNEEF